MINEQEKKNKKKRKKSPLKFTKMCSLSLMLVIKNSRINESDKNNRSI